MQKALSRVKCRLVLSFGVILMMAGCATRSALESPPRAEDSISDLYVSHPDWMGQALHFEPFDAIRKQIENDLGRPLKNRGEAHITVVTPPEWKVLSAKLSMADAEKLAREAHLQASAFEAVCIGKGEAQNMTTYFVVVRSPELLHFRTRLEELFKSKGGQGFDGSHFYPHVTLGYTERDLHEQDGVIKNESSCWKKWATP